MAESSLLSVIILLAFLDLVFSVGCYNKTIDSIMNVRYCHKGFCHTFVYHEGFNGRYYGNYLMGCVTNYQDLQNFFDENNFMIEHQCYYKMGEFCELAINSTSKMPLFHFCCCSKTICNDYDEATDRANRAFKEYKDRVFPPKKPTTKTKKRTSKTTKRTTKTTKPTTKTTKMISTMITTPIESTTISTNSIASKNSSISVTSTAVFSLKCREKLTNMYEKIMHCNSFCYSLVRHKTYQGRHYGGRLTGCGNGTDLQNFFDEDRLMIQHQCHRNMEERCTIVKNSTSKMPLFEFCCCSKGLCNAWEKVYPRGIKRMNDYVQETFTSKFGVQNQYTRAPHILGAKEKRIQEINSKKRFLTMVATFGYIGAVISLIVLLLTVFGFICNDRNIETASTPMNEEEN